MATNSANSLHRVDGPRHVGEGHVEFSLASAESVGDVGVDASVVDLVSEERDGLIVGPADDTEEEERATPNTRRALPRAREASLRASVLFALQLLGVLSGFELLAARSEEGDFAELRAMAVVLATRRMTQPFRVEQVVVVAVREMPFAEGDAERGVAAKVLATLVDPRSQRRPLVQERLVGHFDGR